MRNDCRLPEDWVGSHLERLDRVDGDIDHLIQRIAHIRTWTYITHRGDWLDDNAHWHGRARAIADEIGRASCQERVCQYVSISVVDVSLKKKRDAHTGTHNNKRQK